MFHARDSGLEFVNKSDACAAIHETMSGMYDAGVIEKKTMRKFDQVCLTSVHAFSATEIKALREREEVIQTVFAQYMNVSKDLSASENGESRSLQVQRRTSFLLQSTKVLRLSLDYFTRSPYFSNFFIFSIRLFRCAFCSVSRGF